MRFVLMLALALLPVLAGCAQPSDPVAMTVRPLAGHAPPPALRDAIGVGAVTGGQTTNPLWTSQVSSADFAEALRQSLAAHAMLDLQGRRMRLDATMLSLNQPMVGLDMEVSAAIHYRVVDVATGRTVFERPIAASFTAAFTSHLYAVERLRLANEGAIRANIAAFIAALVEHERLEPERFLPRA